MEYKDYYKTVIESAATTGQKPSIREYLFIKLSDNFLIITLLFLIIIFTCLGTFFSRNVDKNSLESINAIAAWFFDGAKLCLGVFLGLFAGKKNS